MQDTQATQEIANAGKIVEKREALCTVDGVVNWYSNHRKWYGESSKS